MTKNLIFANGIILFYIIQRITEVLISKENERWLKKKCNAIEVNIREGFQMKIFHTLWFISLLLETNIKNDIRLGEETIAIYLFLAVCMTIRFYTIEKLKPFWTIKIFSLKNPKVVTDGLYKYIRHPNYLVVVAEFVLLPLLFKAYFTLIIFSFFNILFLTRRVLLEEKTLMESSEYSEKFRNVKRFVPFVFALAFLIVNPVNAKELKYHHKTYDDAKKSKEYIMFEGESTKLGLITTGFDGYAKDFKINYDLVENQVNGLVVTMLTTELDTNVVSRNDKMINTILNNEKYPEISSALLEKLNLIDGEQTIKMRFKVKDHLVVKPVTIKVEKNDEGFVVSGTAFIGLQELGLPDPSIMIAKVKDEIALKFSVQLKK